MKKIILGSALLLTSVLSASNISAANENDVLNIVRGFGSAYLKKDSYGDPYIKGRIDGTSYNITFYGCTKHKRCDDIKFHAGWDEKVSLTKVNKWNRTKRFSKAYLDKDGDVHIGMPVNLDNGVSQENFEDTTSMWVKVLGTFKKYIGR